MPNARERRTRGDREPATPDQAPARRPPEVDALLALQGSAGNRAASALVQRYWYRRPTQDPAEAIRYSDDPAYDPVTSPTAENLRPDEGLNYFKLPHKKTTFHYLDGQPADPLKHAYVKGLLSESRRVIEKGQEILEALERDLPPETAPFMLGVLETEANILVTHSGAEPKEGFDAVIDSLNKVRDEAKDKQLEYVSESPGKSPEYGSHRLTCAAPKLLATVDAAKLLPAMTEIWFDPSGQGVVVDGIRYHHGQRVPSCTSCEHNLRLMVFKQMRKQVTDAVRVWNPEVAPTASTDLTLERFRRVSKEFLRHFREAGNLVEPLGNPADKSRTEPAAKAVAALVEKAERLVGTPQSADRLRAELRKVVEDAREQVRRHQDGVMEGDPELTNWVAHSKMAAEKATQLYPQIFKHLKAAEESL